MTRAALRSCLIRFGLCGVAVLATLLPTTASADLIITAQAVNVAAGTTNDTLEVTLSNTGTTAVALAGFSFGLTTTNTAISFTQVNISTVVAPYIFAGHSLFGPIISITPPPTGQTVLSSDNYDTFNSGIMLAAGGRVSLGKVLFNVAAGAASGTSTVAITGFPTTSLSDYSGNNVAVTTRTNGSITISGASVPEPASLVLLGLGLTGAIGASRRRRSNMTV